MLLVMMLSYLQFLQWLPLEDGFVSFLNFGKVHTKLFYDTWEHLVI